MMKKSTSKLRRRIALLTFGTVFWQAVNKQSQTQTKTMTMMKRVPSAKINRVDLVQLIRPRLYPQIAFLRLLQSHQIESVLFSQDQIWIIGSQQVVELTFRTTPG